MHEQIHCKHKSKVSSPCHSNARIELLFIESVIAENKHLAYTLTLRLQEFSAVKFKGENLKVKNPLDAGLSSQQWNNFLWQNRCPKPEHCQIIKKKTET